MHGNLVLGINSIYFQCNEVTKDNEVVSIKQINKITTLIDEVNNDIHLIFNFWLAYMQELVVRLGPFYIRCKIVSVRVCS